MSMKMVAPLEVGICVDNLPDMVAFYRDVLGAGYVTSNDVPAEKAEPAGFSATGYQIVRLQLNTGERIKLVKPNGPAETSRKTDFVLDRQGPVFLTFIIDGLDDMIATLKKAGAPLRTGPKKIEIRDGVYLCFTQDPEGNYLELVEYRDISEYRSDIAAG